MNDGALGRRSMGRGTMRILGVLLLGAAAVQGQETRAEIPDSLGLRRLSGPLRVWRSLPAKVEDVRESDRVSKDDRLGTEGGEPARFAVEEGRLLVLLKGVAASRERGVGVAREGTKLRLRHYRGTMVVENFEADFRVDTPHGRLEGKSAYVLIEASEASTRVVAIEGKLTFAGDLGKITIQGGQEIVAEKDRPLAAARPADLSAVTALVAREEAATNLVANAGFEEEFAQWSLPEREGVTPRIDPAARTGMKCCRIELKQARIGQGGFPPVAEVSLVEGARYLVRVAVRVEGYTVDGRRGQVAIRLIELKGGKEVAKHFSKWITPGEEWRYLRFFFTASAKAARLQIGRNLDGTHVYDGSILVDDWYLTPLPDVK